MTDPFATLEPLSQEYRDGYFNMLVRVTTVLDKVPSLKASIDSVGLELLDRHKKVMEAINAGYDVKFDTRLEARQFFGIFSYNFKVLEKNATDLCNELREVLARFKVCMEKKAQYWGWLTGEGKAQIQWPVLLYPGVMREVLTFSSRIVELRITLLAAYEALHLSTPRGFEFALHAAFEAYIGYFKDYRHLSENLAPVFKRHATMLFNTYEEIDQRTVALTARLAFVRKSQQPQESAVGANEENDDDADKYNNPSSTILHSPVDEGYLDQGNDSDSYFPQFNPANGQLMVENSMVDVSGNCYGTDSDHF